MNFNRHSNLEGLHAFLGASKYHWLNYSPEKLDATYRRSMAAQKGTILHAFAADAITLGQKLPRTNQTMNLFVNDAIGFRMTPEVVLYYSDNAFGTADAISFRRNLLRVHDLKTGESPASFMQLLVYAALFCLEYRVKPGEINIELRIYQHDEVKIMKPDPEEVIEVMGKIISSDKIIEAIKAEDI